MRGWFVPGFWPITKISSACSKSDERHRALADADHARQRDAARLVAHVRAVGEVVGPEHAADELSRETPPRCSCAPTCRTRCARGPPRAGSSAHSANACVPRDRAKHRAVVIGFPLEHHRVRDAPELAELEVRHRAQARERQLGEHLGRQPRRRRFLGERLRAVLAELEAVAALGGRLRPRAAGAVEAPGLVHREQRAAAAHEPGVAHEVTRGRPQRAQPAGGVRQLGDDDVVGVGLVYQSIRTPAPVGDAIGVTTKRSRCLRMVLACSAGYCSCLAMKPW